jgi:hypothetical protein
MKISNLLFALPILLFYGKTSAQNDTGEPRKWGIETELVQPFLPTVNIIRIQATYTLTSPEKRRGDLLLGAYIRPNVEHDVVEKINEYMAVVGYRQYLWKGLNLEAKSNMGYAWGTRNLFDGKDYNTPTWFWETNIGYKFDFLKREKTNFYAIAQFGGIGNIVADIGPRGGKPDNFIQGNLLVGIHF